MSSNSSYRLPCRTLLVAGLLLFVQNSLFAQTLLQELTKPPEGRSMRATSTFRKGADGKYDPKADPLQDNTEDSNEDCFLVPPGETKVVLDAKGPGRDHAYLVHVLPARAARMGARRLGDESGHAAADLLGRPEEARRRGSDGRFLLQRLRQTLRSGQHAGRGGRQRLVQLLLEHAVPQGGADRGRQPGREADQPALLQHRLDQERLDARRHAVFPRPVPPGISAANTARIT